LIVPPLGGHLLKRIVKSEGIISPVHVANVQT